MVVYVKEWASDYWDQFSEKLSGCLNITASWAEGDKVIGSPFCAVGETALVPCPCNRRRYIPNPPALLYFKLFVNPCKAPGGDPYMSARAYNLRTCRERKGLSQIHSAILRCMHTRISTCRRNSFEGHVQRQDGVAVSTHRTLVRAALIRLPVRGCPE